MATIDKVKKLVDNGYSNARIARTLNIRQKSVYAYKAHITRREEEGGFYIGRVKELHKEGLESDEIARELGLGNGSVTAYKAHLSRRGELTQVSPETRERTRSYNGLERYLSSQHIVIPRNKLDRLKTAELHELSDLLDKMFSERGRALETRVSTEESDGLAPILPASRVREIILEHLNNGRNCEEIKADSRLARVPMTSIASYSAHFTRGTYSKRRRTN